MYTWMRRIPICKGQTGIAKRWLVQWREHIEKDYSNDNIHCEASLSRYGLPYKAWIFIRANTMQEIESFYEKRQHDEQLKHLFADAHEIFGQPEVDTIANSV